MARRRQPRHKQHGRIGVCRRECYLGERIGHRGQVECRPGDLDGFDRALNLVAVLAAQGVAVPGDWAPLQEAVDVRPMDCTIVGSGNHTDYGPEGWIVRLDNYAASLVTGSPVNVEPTAQRVGANFCFSSTTDSRVWTTAAY